MGGVPACIDPMWLKAAEVTAATFVDLLEHPAEVERARAEFVERTGGGIGGSKWIAPLLGANFPAPIHYRWPEYVETARGPEYSVPDPATV
jgi:aminobenzoyl-glutamate utilization protein B